MRFFNVAATVLLASAGFAAAAENCQAQNILDSCLKTTEEGVKKCSSNDRECLCKEYTDALTCYNNCPDDVGRSGVQSQVTANCNAAKSHGSSSSNAARSEPAEGPIAKGKGGGGDGEDEEEEGNGNGGEASPTESGEALTSTGAASGITVEAGGVVAAVLVGLGAWL